jgi:hypothetical protein
MDIVVFCYNRPDKLRMCLESINLSYLDKLWVFCDGPKHEEDADGVSQTVDVAQNFPYENKKVTLREYNYGTSLNVISALDQVFESVESCFILEDDCVVKPQAYAYIDWALKTFRDDKRIFSVNTMAPLSSFLNKIASLFVKDDIIACNRVYAFWGWATWADRWKKFRPDLEPFKNPYGNAANTPLRCGQHVRLTLRLSEEGRMANDWDVRLLVLTMHAGRLHLHPRLSLMRNIGLDGSGTHFKGSQNSIDDQSALRFSNFVPVLNKRALEITENQTVRYLSLFYTAVIWVRAHFFAIFPKELKLKLRKKLFGDKQESSQF